MHTNLHLVVAATATLGAGWMMIMAGLHKSALEHRRRRRVCPSCGREIPARVCSACAG